MSDILSSEVESYFQSLHSRLDQASEVPFVSVSLDNWHPRPAACHANVDYWTARHSNFKAVRGWLIGATDGCGAYLFIAHSVVEREGKLEDITPSEDAGVKRPRFLGHRGSQREFDTMIFNRASHWHPPISIDLSLGVTGRWHL